MLKKLRSLLIGIPLLVLGCAQGPIEGGAITEKFQDFYADEICRTEPVYVQFILDTPDMIKKVENGKSYFSFLGQEVAKGVPIYKLKDESCSLQFFEKVKPFHIFRLGPWFGGNS